MVLESHGLRHRTHLGLIGLVGLVFVLPTTRAVAGASGSSGSASLTGSEALAEEAPAPRVRYVHHEQIFVSAGSAQGARAGQHGKVRLADGSEREITLVACARHGCSATLAPGKAPGARLPRPGDLVLLDASAATPEPSTGEAEARAHAVPSPETTPALHIARVFHPPAAGFSRLRFSGARVGSGSARARRRRSALRGEARLSFGLWNSFESSLPEVFFEQNVLRLSLHGAPSGLEAWEVDLEAQVIGQARAPALARDHPGARVWVEVREASVTRTFGQAFARGPRLSLGRLRSGGSIDRVLDGVQLDLHRVIPGGLLSLRAGALAEPISLRPGLDLPLLELLASGRGAFGPAQLRWQAQAAYLPRGLAASSGAVSGSGGAVSARASVTLPKLRVGSDLALWAVVQPDATVATILEHASVDLHVDAGETGSFDAGVRVLGDAVWPGDRAFFERGVAPDPLVPPSTRTELDARWTKAYVDAQGTRLRPSITAGVSLSRDALSPLAWGRFALLRVKPDSALGRLEGAYRFEAGWTYAHLLQLSLSLTRTARFRLDLDQEAGVRLLTDAHQISSTGTTRLRLRWRLSSRISLRAQTSIFYGQVGTGAIGRLDVVARLP